MFVITSDPKTRGTRWTSPLWWDGKGVVGILRAHEAVQFETSVEACDALDQINPADRVFYDLVVATDTANLH